MKRRCTRCISWLDVDTSNVALHGTSGWATMTPDQVEAYLQRIGIDAPAGPGLDSLTTVGVKRHRNDSENDTECQSTQSGR